MKKPLVSIIMPTYNCEHYIAESIESVIKQSVQEWELLIVDDCSTDQTKEIVEKYQVDYPDKIYYFKLSHNSGAAVARTLGIEKATGKYVAFLDSDDIWYPEKLEKQISFMEKSGSVFSCTAYEQMNEDGVRLHVRFIPPKETDYNKMLRLSDPIGNLTVVYNQEKLGKYTVPDIKKRNDFALWLKILHDAPVCDGLPDVLAVYRVRKNSISSNKLQLAKYHWQLYREIEKLKLPKAIWAMGCWAWVKGTGRGINKKVGV